MTVLKILLIVFGSASVLSIIPFIFSKKRKNFWQMVWLVSLGLGMLCAIVSMFVGFGE